MGDCLTHSLVPAALHPDGFTQASPYSISVVNVDELKTNRFLSVGFFCSPKITFAKKEKLC